MRIVTRALWVMNSPNLLEKIKSFFGEYAPHDALLSWLAEPHKRLPLHISKHVRESLIHKALVTIHRDLLHSIALDGTSGSRSIKRDFRKSQLVGIIRNWFRKLIPTLVSF